MKYYFAADTHLGLSAVGDSRTRERHFVRWLDEIKNDAAAIFLLGDIFDFWCEYKTVVPRGFTRTLGKLAELTDKGIPVHFFPGNHDLWIFDYLPAETGITVHHAPLEITLGQQNFYLAHGDNAGQPAKGYRRLRWIFTNRVFQKCFLAIHPRWGVAFAHRWSRHSRLSKGIAIPFRGEEEPIVRFAEQYCRTHPVHQFIFGHFHTPVQWQAGEQTQLTILGEWLKGCEYAVFDGEKVTLETWK
ncbi:MAG: UDP-2,3-diacylglucosamine diphosphatase [Prevotellaceae bacterium]|jgi:UDP-2,3-diacylglucosamine hydrolase|nr:UDP-2,3-diacylglucosamine diphosphatase [Prevotellaceae bacterium]